MTLAHSPSAHTQPGSVKTVADILTAAADLIEPEGAWTQGTWARDQSGNTDADRRTATCWCLFGAVRMAAPDEDTVDAMQAVAEALSLPSPGHTIVWNDAPERTQAEVVAALRAAAAKAQESA